MDVVTLGAALSGAKAYTDATIAPLLGGVHYRGSVNYFNNLPSNPEEGDAYTVKYSGASGTSPDGTEYVWALDTDDNTYKWIGFSPDTYTKAEVDNLLNGKQDTLVVGTNLDDVPTEDSTNPITSGGVFDTVGNLDAALDSLIMSLEPKTITANGTYDPTDDGVDGYSEVTVNVGGTSVSKKDVTFYDYDGTVVASYTASEFAELTALPENPTHEGLTSQGWNWTLSDAQTYVASYGKLNIGQMYITSDGKTRLYIELTEGRLQPWLKLYLNANSELDIDWGDGSTHSTFTNTGSSSAYSSEMHTYASAGSYIIAITVVSGGFSLSSSSSSMSTLLTNNNSSAISPDVGYLNSIKRIEIGSGVTSIGGSAFYNCRSLTSITIPSSVTSIGQYAFNTCPSLTSITIPSSVTSIGQYAFANCYSFTSITISRSVTSIGNNIFYNCSLLASITIPSSVTSIGNNAFAGCALLTSITIPSSVTSIGQSAFSSCNSLTSITISRSVTSIGSGAFNNCYSLATITINKASGSISGSPWGASTGSPTSTQIVWTG